MTLYRPLLQSGSAQPAGAMPLVGGPLWFSHVAMMKRGAADQVIAAGDVPADALARLTEPRAPVAGHSLDHPRLMGILNVTPDSFSDGGAHFAPADAVAAAQAMVSAGVDFLDIGGESTRPGAAFVAPEEEIARTRPVIDAIAAAMSVPISIDTRKADVAAAAIEAGAALVNDVSGFTFDRALAPLCAAQQVPVCVMHAQGDPATMQDNPRYDDVVQDVYGFLEAQVTALEAQGLSRAQIVVDPGIGFGKTVQHNLCLLRNISVFHGLGCPILLGVSRKGFIGKLGHAPNAADRAPGSIAVGLAALAQGVQILRVHDVAATAQALALWRAVRENE